MRDIPGFEGLYAVTEEGRIWAYPRKRKMEGSKIVHHTRDYDGKFLSTYLVKGYQVVSLSRGKGITSKKMLVHRIVAEAFLPSRPYLKHEINHKDTDKENNHYLNLEWMTREENLAHARANGLYDALKGERHHTAKLKEEDIRQIRQMFKEGASIADLARQFGVHYSTLKPIVIGRTWKHIT